MIFFFLSSKFEFWLVMISWNHHSFVHISPTIVIDTSMERSSRVLHHGNIKIWFFFQKKSKLNFDLYFVWLVFFLSSKMNFDLYFDLCQRAEIIQVGLHKHLYDDIGDASSSLRGSTSSFHVKMVCQFSSCHNGLHQCFFVSKGFASFFHVKMVCKCVFHVKRFYKCVFHVKMVCKFFSFQNGLLVCFSCQKVL